MKSFFQPKTPLETIDYHIERLKELVNLISETKTQFSTSELYFLNDYTPPSVRKHFNNGQLEPYHVNKLRGIFIKAKEALEILKQPDEQSTIRLAPEHFAAMAVIPAVEKDLLDIASYKPLKQMTFKQINELERVISDAKNILGNDEFKILSLSGFFRVISERRTSTLGEFSGLLWRIHKDNALPVEYKFKALEDILRKIAASDDAKSVLKLIYENYIKDKPWSNLWGDIEGILADDKRLEDTLKKYGWQPQSYGYRR